MVTAIEYINANVFAPLKAAYRDETERLFQGGANTVGKQHFTSLYSLAREKAFTKRNITAVIPKPPAQLNIPRADEIRVSSCYQDEVPQPLVTLVLVEGLASLYNLIKQDTYTLNGTSIQCLERHIQKLVDTAQISFAERALLHNQKQILTRMNNEAQNIEVARAARAAKEVIKGKGKRGRKRKSTAIEVDELEPDSEADSEPEVARAADEVIKGRGKRGRKRKSAALEADEPEPEPEPEVARMIEVSEPYRAPVAQMF
ncbi:hypothetical protein NA56DRAFT_674735 [Hyaloscypha hepaticicola]|uniref:Uncharacterized protein n=1 Tax=Hyaloscypha hepaticicola TaxID=2082293 RepID=A0A2J6PHX9_9HELO|nr:hypothetical protein NA56DRAFT_674735 [Hyaloscypha hepaticicola]